MKAAAKVTARQDRQDFTDEVKVFCGCQSGSCPLSAEFLADHPYLLDFDHMDPTGETDASMVKVDSVANMVGDLRPWDVIVAEINKCQVLCAICHRIKTHEGE
jgi:hypothetical protein